MVAQNEIMAGALAETFCSVLTEWLGVDVMREIAAQNKTPEYADCCASHDYCDANQAMVEAMQRLTGDADWGFTIEDCPLIDAAWDLAEKRNFYLGDA